jgi:hypothetical protein
VYVTNKMWFDLIIFRLLLVWVWVTVVMCVHGGTVQRAEAPPPHLVRAWLGVGSLCLYFYDLGISMFRPSMVLNQRQVSLVVSDWESYLGSLFCHCGLWVIVYVSCLCQNSSHYSFTVVIRLLFLYSFVFSCSVLSFIIKSSWTHTTLHFGLLLTTIVTQWRWTRKWLCLFMQIFWLWTFTK